MHKFQGKSASFYFHPDFSGTVEIHIPDNNRSLEVEGKELLEIAKQYTTKSGTMKRIETQDFVYQFPKNFSGIMYVREKRTDQTISFQAEDFQKWIAFQYVQKHAIEKIQNMNASELFSLLSWL